MPWTSDDADQFKKGLSAKQKKQWAEIANSVLQKCKTDGGTEEACAVSAIRQANGVTGNSQLHINTLNEVYQIREEKHQGTDYIVVPVTMMVEGVHNGSAGPLLHPIDELGRFPGAWDGIPVTIDHPEIDGMNISANSPTIIDSRMVGRVYNTTVDGTKLRAEAWIDKVRLNNISSETLTLIQNGEPIEVSVGVFSDEDDDIPGNWNGEQYEAIARNHRPDHLALLPGGVGACSIEDGCGIRANKKKGGTKKMTEVKTNEDKENPKVIHIQNLLNANMDMGYKQLIETVQNTLNLMDNPESGVYNYLEDVYDSTIIYSKRDSTGRKMYQSQYEIGEDTLPKLIGTQNEVVQKKTYVPVVHMKRSKINNKNGGEQMAEKKEECGQCMEKVIALINNKQTKFTANDREWLLLQEESVLDKLFPKEPEVNEVKKAEPLTAEQILQALSAEDNAALAYGRRQMKERRDNMIKEIQGNTSKETWPDVVLNEMKEDMLERVYNSIKKVEAETVDYSLNAGNRFIANGVSDEEPLYPTGIEIKK